jgi:hypothetical protein
MPYDKLFCTFVILFLSVLAMGQFFPIPKKWYEAIGGLVVVSFFGTLAFGMAWLWS